MYHEVHYPVAQLDEAPVKSPGLCTIKFFKIEDVLTWPSIDPETGLIAAAITLKPGALIYLCDAVDQSKLFTEIQKASAAGPYFEINVSGRLRGSNAVQQLILNTLIHHQWGIIVEDKNGATRLIGNRDSGADFSSNYSSGSNTDSRSTEISWKWEHPQKSPIYEADAFEIIIGGLPIEASCITFIKQFQVGASGAPMNAGDTLFVDSGLVNKRPLVTADGLLLPLDDFSGDIDWTGSIVRRVQKALASNTINFVGAVADTEIIQIYAYTP